MVINSTNLKQTLLVFVFVFISAEQIQAQNDSTFQKPTFAVLPLVYFTPETSWAFGVGAVTNFKMGGSSENTFESQVAVGFAYTLFDQVLSFSSWRLFTKENKNLFAGELGWYDYVYFFYGVGNEIREQDRESFDARLPRLRFDYLRKVSANLYAGFRYHFDNFDIRRVEPSGLLESGLYHGLEGGTVSGFGPMLYYDSRDSQLYPTSGTFAESSLQYFNSAIGSDFRYWRWVVDFRKVHQIKENQHFAWQAYSEIQAGDPPFFLLSQMGGNRLMRGLFEGKFRDNNMAAIQGEYRWKFLPRWGLVGFAGLGNVYSNDRPFQIQNTMATYGLGGRFKLSKREKLNLRLDLAHSPGEEFRFYLTFGEAF
ncbi:BamA/TamA family outer membrane protein [Aquiflexum sp.]|uniref:BamA/TamA family outer membrane protein n=1 Tax=Aquiflexum sp. TaxID=1872584 RepID=UPI00359322A7